MKSVYVGETGNCSYERSLGHLQEYRSNNPETREKSVLRKHVNEVHGGNEDGVEFEMKVTHVFKNDPTGRQVMEGIGIRELVGKVDHILNSMYEFHQPGELIPVLEGARRSNRKHNDNNNYNNNSQSDNSSNRQNGNNSSNSQNDNRNNSQIDNSNNSDQDTLCRN